jgi:DNA-directed RNA polymerase specialized sigma24 family protein
MRVMEQGVSEQHFERASAMVSTALVTTRAWAAPTQALRQSRQKRRGWLTTPADLLQRARALEPRAVASLFGKYRHAVRNFLRSRGVSLDKAEDITQGVFEGILKYKSLCQVDPSRSFGAWLRTCALHHLYNERDRERTQKASLDEEKAVELRAQLEARRAPTGERTLDQRRAKLLVDRAWARLRLEYTKVGDEILFEHLRKTLLLEATETTDAELCRKLGRSSSYVAVARHRLRNEEFPAAILAELREARGCGTRARPNLNLATPQEDLRLLLDAIR